MILTQALESQVYGIVHDSSVYQEIKKLILERKGASTAFDLIFHFKREEHIVTKELAIFILKENVKLSLSTTKKTDA